MHILLAAAEFAPLVNVGGLSPAVAGLVGGLRRSGAEVSVVLPDYFGTAMIDELAWDLSVPHWAAPAHARRGVVPGVGELTLVSVPGIERPHPYVDADGHGWQDNDRRFFAFGAAVAALVDEYRPDVVHLNDWHTATALAHLHPDGPPVVLTIHTLGYQGQCDPGWVEAFPHYREAFLHAAACNPLAGGVRRADLVIAVSPTYAREIVTPQGGFGLDVVLRSRGERLIGIRNGIDTAIWDPATDPYLAHRFQVGAMDGKVAARAEVLAELGLPAGDGVPLIAMVSRLVEQKGVDLALAVVPFLTTLPARLAVLGSGDRHLVEMVERAAAAFPDVVAFRHGYDNALSHRLIAGADLFIMPSRFEPCGLAQMQAMRYGTLPVVSDVGGLHDTVVDVDADRTAGTGIRAAAVSPEAVVDAVHRGVRAWSNPARRTAMRRRGMTADWSWDGPAGEHLGWYRRLMDERVPGEYHPEALQEPGGNP